ncbi:MAG: hypothetical protein QOF33_235 [Thermomicrobiales bacterium]|jgi:ppGpp synthetase/RelA/SpoT-type nucleotidyltranferase|nr:hypothetical protein [Thermomicrobiales bacterium]
MKINNRIRALHANAEERYSRLAREMRETLKPRVEERDWFFRDRVKGLESFALKIETGRFSEPTALEDFYACTIVVHTLSQVAQAEDLVAEYFDPRERRPLVDNQTKKRPSDFPFDDLRIYVARRPQTSGFNADLDGIVFEVQIKTVLQHAWSLATHDLIYKTDTVSWPKERIAYQVKAMLEHAEIAIAGVEGLSREIGTQDEETESILRIINQAEDFWPADALPDNRRRFAGILHDLLKGSGVAVDQMEVLLRAEVRRLGILPRDLSPYALMVQALAHSDQVNLETRFRKDRRMRILIHRDMDLPDWMWQVHERIINIDRPATSNLGKPLALPTPEPK